MAIYHLHVGFVSRSTGRSSVQAAAYICGEKLHEERRDIIADYRGRIKDVAVVNTLAPEHSKYKDLSVWNAVEDFEDKYAKTYFKKENARNNFMESTQVAQTIVAALPNEFSIETNKELVEKFIETRFTSRNLITTYAIHNAEGNLHVHMQITRRAIGEDGEFVNRKDRDICSKFALKETRKLWADFTNEFLAREGHNVRVTEQSYYDLGINQEAAKHRGWYADTIGTDSVNVQKNIEIAKRNEGRILADPSIILDLLNEKKAVFTQKDILLEISGRVLDEKNIAVIFEKVLELEETIYVGESVRGDFLYTGEKYQQLESDVFSKFDALSSKTAKTSVTLDSKISVLSKYDYLSDEQKAAVIGLTKGDNFGILVGKAGAGKTTTMKAISEIYAESGAHVIGMSLSAVASENLGKDASIESATIASWVYRWEKYEAAKERFLSFDSVVTDGLLKQLDWYNDLQRYEQYQLKSGDVIIVDEAGMVGAREWYEVFNAAEKFNAKVISVGDDNQFKPISAGDCFRYFIEACNREVGNDNRNKNNIFELNEIRRQKETWMREASVEFSKLNVAEGLVKYEDHGRLHAINGNVLYSRIAEKYLEIEKSTRVELGSCAVLCSTNKECIAINDAIRSLKKERGELGGDIVNINGRGFAENDKIIFLENNKYFDVKNGQCGIVKGFSDGIFSVETESGILDIDNSEYSSINHSYAITLHKSQGKTYDNAVLVISKQGVMDANSIYVGCTRHKDGLDIFYDKSDFSAFKSLVNSVSKNSYKDSLVDYRDLESGVNLNKARVFEYQSLRLETTSVLKDIAVGEVDWSDYHALKQIKINLEKTLLENYDSSKHYLNQLGISKERLEEFAGIRQRTETLAEKNAKIRVFSYAEAARDSRELWDKINSETIDSEDPDAFKKHDDYEKFMEIRKVRNALAQQIVDLLRNGYNNR